MAWPPSSVTGSLSCLLTLNWTFLRNSELNWGSSVGLSPIQYAFPKSHTTLVIEICHRTLRFLKMYFLILATIFKTYPRASSKVAASPANINCGILQARFYTGLGRKATSSKRRMSGGSLTSWGCTFIRFSVQGKGTHCGCCYCSIICSGGYICCSRGDWPFKLIVSVESPQKEYRYNPRSDFHVSVDRLVYLLVKVQSDKDQGDRYRMLLQAACAARLGCMSYKNPFIVVALYIENSGMVTQYFVFQRDGADPRVCTFESKISCIFSLVLLGFLCLVHPRLKATAHVVYWYIRKLQPGIDNTK